MSDLARKIPTLRGPLFLTQTSPQVGGMERFRRPTFDKHVNLPELTHFNHIKQASPGAR